MKKIFKIYLPIAIITVLLFLFLQPNPYFRRAIIYNTANISDYKIFKNREIKTGKIQEWKLSDKYNNYNLSSEDSLLHDKYQSVAFLVIKDTTLLYEAYWDNYSEKSYSSSFSMAKSVVGLLIGIAIDEGLISSVNDPVSKYIPEFKNKTYQITIRDLLTMSSGLEWDESYFNPFSVTTKAYYGRGLNKLVLKAKSTNIPAKEFEYITANPQLLSIILKNVTGKSISEYTSEKLWKPLGAENAATWSLDTDKGNEKAFCCFNSNARDFARLGQLILNKGRWNTSQIISEKYLNEALSPATYLVDKKDNPVNFYGYQWWITKYNNQKVHYARGILGQYIISIPHKNMVIVRLGHKRDKEKLNSHPKDLFKYIDLALKIEKY